VQKAPKEPEKNDQPPPSAESPKQLEQSEAQVDEARSPQAPHSTKPTGKVY
jgi:hypothetical protein